MSGILDRPFLTIITGFTEGTTNIFVGSTVRQTAFVPHPAFAGLIKINLNR
jgi:hypothetical protein